MNVMEEITRVRWEENNGWLDEGPSEGHSVEIPFEMTLEGREGRVCLQAGETTCQPLRVEM